MEENKRKGRPAGEVQVGEGFDEKLKRLAELFQVRSWSFCADDGTAVNGDTLTRLASEQEADSRIDHDAWSGYQRAHEAVMQRQGRRGVLFAAALVYARTVAKRNRDLLKLIEGFRIRLAGRKRSTAPKAEPGPKAP